MDMSKVTKGVSGVAGWFSEMSSRGATRGAAAKKAGGIGRFGVAMPALGVAGAVGAVGMRAAYNKTEGDSGGYGKSAFMGAVAGVAAYATRGKNFGKRMGAWRDRSTRIGAGRDMMEDAITGSFNRAPKGSYRANLMEKMGKSNAISGAIGSANSAVTGAIGGGIYGAFSDDETVMSGAFKGAVAGGVIGGARGGGVRATRAGKRFIENKMIANKMMTVKNIKSAKSTKTTSINKNNATKQRTKTNITAQGLMKSNAISSRVENAVSYIGRGTGNIDKKVMRKTLMKDYGMGGKQADSMLNMELKYRKGRK